MSRVAKQFVLIAIAVAVGAFVLQFGFDEPESTIAASADPEPTPTEAPVEAPTPTPPTGPAPSTVPVLVANSTGVPGLAGSTSELIGTTLGYTMLPATDSTGPQLDTTAIFAVAGAEADGQAIAVTLGLNPTVVAAMPAAPPVADLAGAQVLVVIGFDLAPAE